MPGYYHRRTETGDLCTSACCNNTAPEHLMFERLIVDDIVHWTKTYKVFPSSSLPFGFVVDSYKSRSCLYS